MTIFDTDHSDGDYFHCCLCISSLFHSKIIRWSVPSTCFPKIVLCWKGQHGREDYLIQGLLSWLQHFYVFCGDDSQLQAISYCIPRSGMTASFWISKNSVEHKLCRKNTVNLFFISLCLFNGFGRERNPVQLECSSVLKVADPHVFAGNYVSLLSFSLVLFKHVD